VKLYFAGAESRNSLELLKKNKVTNILQSAYYLNYKKKPNEINFKNCLLDSGGFTAIKQGVAINVKDYADYLNKNKVKIAFNLDVRCTYETLKNQSYLESKTNTYIIPVYHWHEFISSKHRELIKTYSKRYPLISLGGNPSNVGSIEKEVYFNYCFDNLKNNCKVHGLGVTSYKFMLKYPWYSVDSTTWLMPEIFGQLVQFYNGKLIKHESPRVAQKITSHKYFIEDKKVLLNESISAFIKFEQYATNLWEARGVKYNEKESWISKTKG
jgi:hypothetical protein